MARMQGIEISLDYLIDIVRTGHETHEKAICVDGVPETAKFLYTLVSEINKKIVLVFEDESFEDLPIGTPVPVKSATMMVENFYNIKGVSE